ncbi:uncharacterized protein O3C94_016562 [Discoglossus pictus]
MAAIKQENYALLHDDSDLDDFDKNKSAQMKPKTGNSYLRRSSDKLAWTQPHWLCHTIFIAILILLQIALCIYVLLLHTEMETMDLKQASIQKNAYGMRVNLHTINNTSSSRSENLTQMPEHPGMNFEYLLKRVNTVEMNMKSMKKIASIHNEDMKALQTQQQVEGIKYENALERQFNNMTRALNSLQNRLEEALDIVFSQISQLRDDIYFIENALNHTKQERLGENNAIKPTKKGLMTQGVTEPLMTANQTVQGLLKPATTMQLLSRQMDSSNGIYQISISLIKSRTDFQMFFYGADKDANGYLTYDEIKTVLGEEAPTEDVLGQFDADQSRKYSYTELLQAFQLND